MTNLEALIENGAVQVKESELDELLSIVIDGEFLYSIRYHGNGKATLTITGIN